MKDPFLKKCLEVGAEPSITNDTVNIRTSVELSEENKFQIRQLIPGEFELKFSTGIGTGTLPALNVLCGRVGLTAVAINILPDKHTVQVGLPQDAEIEEPERFYKVIGEILFNDPFVQAYEICHYAGQIDKRIDPTLVFKTAKRVIYNDRCIEKALKEAWARKKSGNEPICPDDICNLKIALGQDIDVNDLIKML
jgi:hypothetical protein